MVSGYHKQEGPCLFIVESGAMLGLSLAGRNI